MVKYLMLLLVVLLYIAGCASAPIGPGSGVAAGVVKGTVDDINQKAETVLKQMNVQLTGSSVKNSGNERTISGKMGDTDVTVTLDNAPNTTTNVEVQASKNMVNGNKDLAKEILSQIVQHS